MRRKGLSLIARRTYSDYTFRLKPMYLTEGTVDDIIDDCRAKWKRLARADRRKDAFRATIHFVPLDARSRKVSYRSKKRFLKQRDAKGRKVGVKLYRYELEQAVITTPYVMRRDSDYLFAELRSRLFAFLSQNRMLYSTFADESTEDREYVTKKVIYTLTQASGLS